MCKNTQVFSKLIEQRVCTYSKNFYNNNTNNIMEPVDYNESRDTGERLSGFTSQLCHYQRWDFGVVK